MSQTLSTRVAARRHVFRRWPQWTPYAAAAWALGYGIVALVWTFTGSGFPIGRDDSSSDMALLGDVPADVGAPLFAAVALAGAGIAMVMARVRPVGVHVRLWWRRFALGFGSVLAAVLLVAIPDTRILALVGYLPMIIAKAPFDAEMRARVGEVVGVEHVNQLVALVGGFLWAAATLVYARRTAGTCRRCGRGGSAREWTTPAAAARWGRPAVYVAAVIPALYAVTRWIWVAGLPLGIDEQTHAQGMADGSLWAGAWLASFALVGAVLTLGLVQRWGEVFPDWVPVLRGRTVPVGLAVGPASFVSVIVTSGGLGMIKTGFGDGLFALGPDTWAAIGPALLWPLWGVALAAGTLAYYLRRRGQCPDCGMRA